MRDIAVQETVSAGQGRDRHEDGLLASARPVSEEPADRWARRLESVSQQWHHGWQKATAEGWSVSPPRSMRCEDAEGSVERVSSGASLTPIARFLARDRRAVLVSYMSRSTAATTQAPSDVVSQSAPREMRIKKTYTSVEVFRALSSCSAPFTHASQIADDLFAIADYPEFTPEHRSVLRRVATIADQLASLAPTVFIMQSVCKVFGIIANLLENKPVTPNDIIDVNALGRSFMTLRRASAPLYLKGIHVKGRAPRPDPMKPTTIARTNVAENQPRSHIIKSDSGTVGAPSKAITPELEERPITTLDLFYSEAGERTLTAPPEEASVGDDEARSMGETHVEEPDEASPLGQEEAAIRRISASMPPVKVQWAKVQSVPVRRRGGAQARWERVPPSEYAVGSVDARGRDEGEIFIANGKSYLCLDGCALSVRPLFPGPWWIVDNHAYPGGGSASDRLPPLPLRTVAGGPADRFVVKEPVLVDIADAYHASINDDGFIRYAARKFIEMDGKRVETSRMPILGEDAIFDFAAQLGDALPAADAMQIIRLSDGSRWIEGEHGFYRLRFDLALQDFYVVEASDVAAGGEPRRALVDFDIARRQWTALVSRRRAGYEDVLAARYLLVEEQTDALRESEHVVPKASRTSPAERGTHAGNSELAHSSTALQPESGNAHMTGLSRPGSADIEDIDDVDDSSSLTESRSSHSAGRNEAGASDAFPLYASSETGLERESALFKHYAKNLKLFPFFGGRNVAKGNRMRRRLRHGLTAILNKLHEVSMIPANRMEPAVRAEFAPLVLSLRQRLLGLYPPAEQWYSLTLQQKQQQVAHMVQVAYRASTREMWPSPSGYCNEFADVVLSNLVDRRPKLRENLMQVALYDQKGTKATHVMLLYADQPATLDVFADRATQDVRIQRQRRTFSEAGFYDWLMINRDFVLLIDAWATNKLVDLSTATSHALVRNELLPHLLEAGFDINGAPRFKVRAVLPRRPGDATRPRREVERVRMLSSAPATWEVLAEWAVTGVLPDGASAGALSADLTAAADSAGDDTARQSLLRTLADEIAPGGQNGTEPEGIDRRTLVMAGRAAWALLDTVPVASDSAAPGNATSSPDAFLTTNTPDLSETLAATTATELSAATAESATTETIEIAGRADAMSEETNKRLAPYASMRSQGADRSAVQQSGPHTYVWMPGGNYYAVREIMPGRLFIVDPDERPSADPSLPPIPLERDGSLWRISTSYRSA